jgi:hypothetical protein
VGGEVWEGGKSRRNASLVTRTSFQMLNAKLIHTVGFINNKKTVAKKNIILGLI